MKFLSSGKVKDIYEIDADTILFKFSDRVSAYDVKFKETIPKKGKVLCNFAQYWFDNIPVENHFIEKKSDTEIIVQKMQMLPIECVVRGYFYGSLVNRWKTGQIQLAPNTDTRLASKLPSPIFDPTTKSEHDMPITQEKAIKMNLVTKEEFDYLSSQSIKIYNIMSEKAALAGFILADLKLEFGKLDNKIILGDSIGPDECRLWLKDNYHTGEIQQAYDKQILRDWLSSKGYEKQFENTRNAGKEPIAPAIPVEIIEKMTLRYTTAYEKITGHAL